LARIKALREAGLRAEHVAFSFMKRRLQPLMARDTLGYEYTGTTTRRRCLETKSMTTTLLTGSPRSSRICRPTRRAPYRSTPLRAHQKRLVAASVVEYPLLESSRTDELFLQDDLKKFVSEPPPPLS
jgi:hypothetical protein